MVDNYLPGSYELHLASDCLQEAMLLLDCAHVSGWDGGASQAEAQVRLSIRAEIGLCQMTLDDTEALLRVAGGL